MSAAYRFGKKTAELVTTIKSIPNEAYHYFMPNLAAATDAYSASKAMQNNPYLAAQMQYGIDPSSMAVQQPVVHHRHYRHHNNPM